ncbi:MAG TPA: hypothetical protein VFY87_09240 [Geminicoccaceae bacterium]|nr:hypothetical protein [Geminicoccaceae bacterium]
MSSRIIGAGALALAMGAAPGHAPPAAAQAAFPLEACDAGAFSTEEDFVMERGEPFDGNPYISDGDLLSTTGQVCARNADLLRAYDVKVDLGLDAVDVIDVRDRVVAFSTELDSPFGSFGAGDVLFTTGGVIPNGALLFPFGVRHDVGLDEVKLMGDPERIRRFAEAVRGTPPEKLVDGGLQQLLRELNIDLWFSIEGTAEGREGLLLTDGDILAASGVVVRRNPDLFVASIPAGVPTRGVDMGVDAFAVARDLVRQTGEVPRRFPILFSTEILYQDRPPFSDGDVLQLGGGIAIPHQTLTKPFFPATPFLGLDALYLPSIGPGLPNITQLCARPVGQFDSATGLLQESRPRSDGTSTIVPRPCGMFVPVDGYLPPAGVKRFRIAYREIGDPVPAIGTGPAIDTTWIINDRGNPTLSCEPNPAHLLQTVGGWMDAATYLEAWGGGPSTDFCPNPGVRLGVWNTLALPPGPAPGHDREDHFIVWLVEWEDTGGTLHRESLEHHVQLDNTAPAIPAYPNGLQVRLPDGSTPVAACGEAPNGTSSFQVWADFADRFHEHFTVSVLGGSPPASFSEEPHFYYNDPVDSSFENTNDTGTVPGGTLVHVRDVDMTKLGASFTDCCYLLDLWVWGRALLHSFNSVIATEVNSHANRAFVTFSALP